MPHPILSSLCIQAGMLMVDAGLKRLLPEIALMLDEPEIVELQKYVKPEKLAKEVLASVAKRRLQS